MYLKQTNQKTPLSWGCVKNKAPIFSVPNHQLQLASPRNRIY